MSGYFTSLMRSSGLPFGGRSAVRAHVEPGMAEVDIEHTPAAPPANIVPAAFTSPQAIAPIHACSLSQLATPTVPAAQTNTHSGHKERASTEPAQPRAAAMVSAAADGPPARAIEMSKPDLGQALVRAAMQWVAADRQQARGDAPFAPPPGQSLPLPGDTANMVGGTQTIRHREGETPARPSNAARTTTVVPDVSAHDPLSVQPLPIRAVRQIAAMPPAPVAPSPRDEVVEVSIGAIHVRVDAPAAQTIARPLTAPPVSPPRGAEGRPVRSSLGRRALRRI